MAKSLILIVALLLACGCAAIPHTQSALSIRERQDLARLHGVALRLGTPPGRLQLVQSPRIAACAWPDGRMQLTEGVVESCSDAELAAVIAHELGHLQLHREGRRFVCNLDEEIAADACGRTLLLRGGYPASAMQSLLSRLGRMCDASRRSDMATRLSRLQAMAD